MGFLALVTGTIREAIAKKIILGFFILSSLIILIFIILVNTSSIEGMVAMMETAGEEGMKGVIIGFEQIILNVSYLFIITISLISVSSFIPSMLEKGNIDLLLSKPVSRIEILLGKFTGGTILIFLNLVYLIGAVWLILSLKSGFWHLPFLYSIVWLTISFAVIYSLVILIGLTTQSTVLTAIITLFLVIIVLPLLGAHDSIAEAIGSDAIKFVLNFFYYVLPKPGGIIDISLKQITGDPVESYQPLYTSLLFMITMISVSIYYFKNKDY